MIRTKRLDAAYAAGQAAALNAPTVPHNAGLGGTLGRAWTRYEQWAHAAGHRDMIRALTRCHDSDGTTVLRIDQQITPEQAKDIRRLRATQEVQP